MNVSERIQEIETAAGQSPFIRWLIRTDETFYSVKYRLHITPDLFVQLYFNERSHTVGMALVDRGMRLYGRDSVAGVWHCHPFEHPADHDMPAAGSRPVSVAEFLAEVQAILLEAGLI